MAQCEPVPEGEGLQAHARSAYIDTPRRSQHVARSSGPFIRGGLASQAKTKETEAQEQAAGWRRLPSQRRWPTQSAISDDVIRRDPHMPSNPLDDDLG
jgi:hypothetical protein